MSAVAKGLNKLVTLSKFNQIYYLCRKSTHSAKVNLISTCISCFIGLSTRHFLLVVSSIKHLQVQVWGHWESTCEVTCESTCEATHESMCETTSESVWGHLRVHVHCLNQCLRLLASMCKGHFRVHVQAPTSDATCEILLRNYCMQGHRVKIRAPGQSGHGPSHIEQLRAQYIYFHKLTMLTVDPAGPCRAPKSRRAPGHLPPLPPLSAGLTAWPNI